MMGRGFRDILVAFDSSPASERALTAASDLALSANARLTVLSSAPHVPPVAYTGAAGFGVAALGRCLEEAAERALAKRIDELPDEICVTKVFTEQPIRRAIMCRLERGEHDLVVVGSRGHGRIRSALFGSLSRYVVRHSPIPVLVVHGESRELAEDLARPATPGLRAATPRAV